MLKRLNRNKKWIKIPISMIRNSPKKHFQNFVIWNDTRICWKVFSSTAFSKSDKISGFYFFINLLKDILVGSRIFHHTISGLVKKKKEKSKNINELSYIFFLSVVLSLFSLFYDKFLPSYIIKCCFCKSHISIILHITFAWPDLAIVQFLILW